MSGPFEPEVVAVPAGEIALGDTGQVTDVNVFAMARRPTSWSEYAAFRTATGAGAPPASPTSGGDGPVTGVGWPEAIAYCRWLTQSSGRTWRLPDEREWEKAARLGLLEGPSGLAEWTNTWSAEDRARVLRGLAKVGQRIFDPKDAGFRVVLGMTGR